MIKRMNRLELGIALCIVVAILALATKLLREEPAPKNYQISVIVNDSNSSRWTPFQEGIKKAADENHVRLNYVTTDLANSAAKQKKMIEKEVDSGADGLIIQLYKSNDSEQILKYAGSNRAIELVDCESSDDDMNSGNVRQVGINNKKAGKTLADEIKRKAGDGLNDKSILLLSGNQSMHSMAERRDAFINELKKYHSRVRGELDYTNSDTERISDFMKDEDFDTIVAMDDAGLSAAIDYVKATGVSVSILGIGNSDKNLYYLDKGTIDLMLVPNEYNMGYSCMVDMINRLNGNKTTKDCSEVEFATATAENMYDEDIERILFPIIQ
jgi:ABC-type sugar transport system substrate-binding protein